MRLTSDSNPIDLLAELPAVRALSAALASGDAVAATGSQGASAHLLAGAVAKRTSAATLLLVAHLDEADDAADALRSLGVRASVFPALELLRAGETVAPEALAERLRVAQRLIEANEGAPSARERGSQAGRENETAHPGGSESRPTRRTPRPVPLPQGEMGERIVPLPQPLSQRERGEDAAPADFPAPGSVLVAPIHALMQTLPPPEHWRRLSLDAARGQRLDPADVVRWLDSAGYTRVDAIEEPGDFAVRGGIIDVFAPGALASPAGSDASAPVSAIRLDFFGDELEALREIDVETMGADRALVRVRILSANADALTRETSGACLLDWLPRGVIAIVHETLEVSQQGRGYFERASGASPVVGPPRVLQLLREKCQAVAEANQYSPASSAPADAKRITLPVAPLPTFPTDAGEAAGELLELACERRVVALCQNDAERSRLRELLRDAAAERRDAALPDRVEIEIAYVHRGFAIEGAREHADEADGHESALVVPYHELLHRSQVRRAASRVKAGRARDAFIEMAPGDFVVHAEHGVGRFVGLETGKAKRFAAAFDETDDAGLEERLILEFAQGVRLHVPASQIDKVQKHIGAFRGAPTLSTVGGRRWRQQKEKVREAVRDLAAEMLRVQAIREQTPGVAYPDDTAWQREFEAAFPYEETEDQLAALNEIKRDMRSSRPMDRLLCGDVGFGKTEVAIRAAFKTMEFGKQAAVVVPTTVLAEQHERVFRERLADYPFRVEAVSRLKSHAEQTDALKALARGEVDLIVGTHRLLSKDVRFADLGLLIVDEEQRFGVEHKQRLLEQRATVDVLTLTATPIPRTLHMALLGLRDISSLATPPLDRRAIVTEVIPWNDERVKQALARELAREGQVFIVHNRVRSIERVRQRIEALAPGARVVVGHGQMPAKELERVMLAFVRRRADILVCTTIIESGVDIPTANTMLITDADRYGLADLHQLRGRVGRHKHRAYCMLLLPEDRVVTDKAKRRLQAIEQFNMLGAGFRIAMRDLEIRGAGNLLGAEQSGHIAAVGYDMYCRLLEREVRSLRNETAAEPMETTVDLGVAGLLPRAHIPSDARRLEMYRRLSQARTLDEIDDAQRDMESAYGEPPRAAKRLLDLARLRTAAAGLGVVSVRRAQRDVIFESADPQPVAAALRRLDGAVRTLEPKRKGSGFEVYYRPADLNQLRADALPEVLWRALAEVEPARTAALAQS